MRPADGCHLFFIGSDAVLFHEAQQKLFHLNATAASVWCLLEEFEDIGELTAALRSALTLSTDQAASYVHQAVWLLKTYGVLEGNGKRASPAPAATLQYPDPVDYGQVHFMAERRYALLSSRFRIRFTAAEQLALIDPVLQHLRDDASAAATVSLDIVGRAGGGAVLCRDGAAMQSCNLLNHLAPLVKGLVWQTAIEGHAYFLSIHAGVVGDGRRCYLFPAAQGSGKSMLTAALLHHGFEYFSDEVALLHGKGLYVEAVPLALCIKDSGVAALSPYYPHLRGLPVHRRNDGKWVRYLPPPPTALARPKTRRPVAAIVFPRYAPEEKTALDAIGTLEALQLLMRECLTVDGCLRADDVAGLIDWIGSRPVYRLTVSSLDEAAVLMRTLSAGAPIPVGRAVGSAAAFN